MPTLFNFRGYAAPDPIDKASGFMRYALLMMVNLVLSVILILLLVHFKLIRFNGFTLFHIYFSPRCTMAAQVIINCLIFSAALATLRKSGSLISLLIVLIPYFLAGLFIISHHQNASSPGIPALKAFLLAAVYGIVLAILGLFIARILAAMFYSKRPYPRKPAKAQYNSLFRKEWSDEEIPRPKRDVAFYILRLLGFAYLAYLVILILGLPGSSPWPAKIGALMDMTYDNPALAINTYFKIMLMIILAFTGAYNSSLRYYAGAALLTGHLVSTVYSLVFHYCKVLHATDADFLLASAGADGPMIIIFLWVMIRYRKEAKAFAPEHDLPINFSVPLTLMRYLFRAAGYMFLLIALTIIGLRIFTAGNKGLSAVFGAPDPMVGNTLTLYATLSLIAFMLVKRERLRQYFFNALTVPLIFGSIVALLWIIIGSLCSGVLIHTRQDTYVQVDWYFILHAACCMITAGLFIAFRRMYYRVDYAVNTLSPSAAIDAIALTQAFFGGDDKHQAAVLHSIDQYAGGIRGRKRGLLNLPFGLFENVLNFIYGLRPPFSAMSRDEQRYFLRKYFLRNEAERDAAFVPLLADFAYQIGLSLNSIVMFAHYSYVNVRNDVGYVPVDARDRTQGDCASYDPPHKTVAALPKDHVDPNNFKPAVSCTDGPLVAPRVTALVREDDIPDEADYIIIGSGAGGATAAYRLARAVKDPSKILVVERGSRYQPLQDFQDSEIEMMKKVYKEGGLQQTKTFSMTLLQGECVGGSTVVNNAVCFHMPENIRQSWQQQYGLDLSGLTEEYDRIAQELNIRPLGTSGINQAVQRRFQEAVTNYNALLPAEDRLITDYPVLANHTNNMGDGNWNLGNKRMRKRSMLETYIPWSEARGVKIVSNMTAVRFTSAGNRQADYVVLRSDNGELSRVKVRKAVIVAGGVVASSHFLMRSELRNNNIGKRLSCNFAFPVTVEFDEELKAYDGEQITLGALDPHSRSAFETYFNPPASFALSSVPFFFNRRSNIMSRYKYLVNFGSLLGSEANGIIQQKADLLNGQAFTWELGEKDISNIKYGLTTLVQLGKLAGGRRVILPTKPGIELALTDENIREFIRSFNAFPLRMTDLYAGTAHPQGGNLMAGEQSPYKNQRVTDESFRVEGYDNVFVADASLFPTSITINPQWTIMAMSAMAARSVLRICG